jgi:hypothetical protein
MARRREYTGYPISRIIMGVNGIRRRNRPHREADDVKYYLMTFGFNDTSEFAALLARRTSDRFAAHVLRGTFPRRVETRARKRRKREYAEFLRNNL